MIVNDMAGMPQIVDLPLHVEAELELAPDRCAFFAEGARLLFAHRGRRDATEVPVDWLTGPLEARHVARRLNAAFGQREHAVDSIVASVRVTRRGRFKQRSCLMCGDDMLSRHFGDRVCEGCKRSEAWHDGNGPFAPTCV